MNLGQLGLEVVELVREHEPSPSPPSLAALLYLMTIIFIKNGRRFERQPFSAAQRGSRGLQRVTSPNDRPHVRWGIGYRSDVTRDEFIQAKAFMQADISREIELARLPPGSAEALALVAAGIAPGGGNLLAALGLLCYTEFGGKLKFDVKKHNGTSSASGNFNAFFDYIGTDYAAFRGTVNVYDIFRCGLAHEYHVKKDCAIYMFNGGAMLGIGTEPSGKHYFVVETYFRDLLAAFDRLQVDLFGA